MHKLNYFLTLAELRCFVTLNYFVYKNLPLNLSIRDISEWTDGRCVLCEFQPEINEMILFTRLGA